MTAIFAIVKRLLASDKISFILTALVVLCATSSGEVVLSNGNYTWLLAVLTPFFFVFYDFTKLMHLGASKKDYFFGCLISYVFLAFCISLVNTVVHLLIDPLYPARTVINLMDVCKWTENGIAVAGLQQMVFLLLAMVFLHVLLSMQAHWYGWVTDAVLVAIICIFYTDRVPAGDLGWIFPAHYAQRQRRPAHRDLPAAERRVILRRACGAEKKNAVDKRAYHDSDQRG